MVVGFCLLQVFDNIFNYILSCSFFASKQSLKQCFCPDYAMDEFFWLLSDSAYWESLLFDSFHALVARCYSFLDTDAGHLISICASFYQGLVHIETHLIDIFPGFNIVECIYHEVKLFNELEPKPFLLYPAVVSFNLDIGILFLDLHFECK